MKDEIFHRAMSKVETEASLPSLEVINGVPYENDMKVTMSLW